MAGRIVLRRTERVSGRGAGDSPRDGAGSDTRAHEMSQGLSLTFGRGGCVPAPPLRDCPSGPAVEDGADPDIRGAFLGRDAVVLRGAHRQLAQAVLLGELPQAAEV